MDDEKIRNNDVIIYEDRYLFQFSDKYGNPNRLTIFSKKNGGYNYLKVKDNIAYDIIEDTFIEQDEFYKNNYTKATKEKTELFFSKLEG